MSSSVSEEFDALADVFDALPIGAREAADLFLTRMPDTRQRALDIGCGTGRTVAALSPWFEEVYGVDVSSKMLEKARQRCECLQQSNARFSLMDGTRLAFDQEQFDYVVSHTTFHHVDHLQTAFMEARRVVRPAGRLVIVDILREGATARWPTFAARVLAAAMFGRDLFRVGAARALSSYASATDQRWLAHQARERFLARQDIVRTCAEVLPNASVHATWKELGLTRYVQIEWDKPEV